ncbi:GNAT family N-acetyltransferase [Georgenia sp. SYP-B2076]|uniref:GNAT family N-acetyltransferase n=1 Tax=Georgenia sp. SYP-B2076 TaxID=2495881 RepID=UPI000F8F559F|nr:GNAT family N-acetyltransferase [Georgenia sp. SYP-B2076]
MDTSTTITIRHNSAAHRFELLDEGRVIGEADYLPFDGAAGGQRIFFHTVVDEEYGGQGWGSRLATVALEDTVAAGMTIVPVCPYIHAFLGRHPEFARHAVAVRTEHLVALRQG